ncbi:FAD-dependent monooxygenase [Burkholderia gladioli]|uniref:FAD-dependent monooxygenase n=1 Tax=Burkholderia gladioli TaxID=28095 RepID=UPI001640C1FF|nr:FAD-dependent monooxygenase [Burkholderia gladioli]
MLAVPLDIAPVLIVGAGPTGLAAALSLAKAKLPVRIVDQARRPAPHSRAIGIQARTLELLEQHRIVEPFLELGHRARVAHLVSAGRRIAELDFDPLQTRYPYLLMLEQTETERILTEHLASFDILIERGVKLSRCRQDGETLRVLLEHEDGREETLAPSWLVAADGAHSTLRHLLGASFAGHAFEQTFLLADVAAEPGWPDDEIHLHATHDGLAGMLPLGHGRYRIVADRPPRDAQGAEREGAPAAQASSELGKGGADDDAPSLETCRALVRERIDPHLAIDELGWSSYFHLHSRMIEHLRIGRVLFAGDAAHVHSPAGAQGMNTGIQEAFNLGWKLARVLTAGAPERLLDTYHAERHPIEREVLRQTSFITQVVEADHGPLKLLREHVVPVLASLGPVRDALRRSVSELAVQYRRSPLTLERVLDGGPRAGERAPDALLRVLDGPLGGAPGVARVFDLHDPAHFTLLLLEAGPAGEAGDAVHAGDPDGSRLAQALDRLMPGAIRTWRVIDTDEDGAPPLDEVYGHTRPCFYLIRPDGYLAARGRSASDANALLRHCETWFAAFDRRA